LVGGDWDQQHQAFGERRESRLIRPKASGRSPLAPDVPDKYGEDYKEACV
jgi:hypothetical protein